MDIGLTRAMVQAALSGSLDQVPCDEDPLFHVGIPRSCLGVPDPKILQPKKTWADPAAYDRRARKLAEEFRVHFEKTYGNKTLPKEISSQCPGK